MPLTSILSHLFISAFNTRFRIQCMRNKAKTKTITLRLIWSRPGRNCRRKSCLWSSQLHTLWLIKKIRMIWTNKRRSTNGFSRLKKLLIATWFRLHWLSAMLGVFSLVVGIFRLNDSLSFIFHAIFMWRDYYISDRVRTTVSLWAYFSNIAVWNNTFPELTGVGWLASESQRESTI